MTSHSFVVFQTFIFTMFGLTTKHFVKLEEQNSTGEDLATYKSLVETVFKFPSD